MFDEYKSSLSNVLEENEVRRCSLDSLYFFDSGFAAYMRNLRKSLKPDLDRYLETDRWPITGSLTDDFDIIGWWKGSGGMGFPVLSKMVKDILAIQIYTESSKSIFCTSDKLVSPHKSKLRADTLEALMCTQNWLSKDLTGECSKEKRCRLC
nr:zinc finger BED domain-containing protein DAYSLEEPER-like [Ipomoea batatas]GMC52208.1 zinc finger BED domain-containing protein DAYSLEEPER-like [Ipomoea batatas]GMC54893.1 zinc finger BED domain-containing protein DAYSLEEPER-like [Ipomoea batatas]